MDWTRRGFLVGLTATAGCSTVGTDQWPPKITLEERFLTGARAPLGDVSQDPWWTDFGDALLNKYVTHGLSANLNVRTALARIEQAQAAARQTGINAQLDGSFSSSFTRSGGDTVATGNRETYALSGSYIFDLFGGVRRARERSLAELEAAGFSAGDARLAFLSDLLGNYITARFNQSAAELTRRSIRLRSRTLELVQTQRNVGVATELDVVRARADFEATQADLPDYIAGFNSASFAIATLLNRQTSQVYKEMQRGAAQPIARSNRSTGVPANLVRNVPSVRASEKNFAASVAAIGVAEAQLYPSLVLGGNVATGTTDSWSFGPELVVPLLNQGLLRARRDEAVAVAKQAELGWRLAVRQAVQSVEASSSNLSNDRRQVSALRKAVASQRESLSLTRSIYENGDLSLLDLIDTERTTLNQQIALAAATRDAAISWVQLQIATGRGWNT